MRSVLIVLAVLLWVVPASGSESGNTNKSTESPTHAELVKGSEEPLRVLSSANQSVEGLEVEVLEDGILKVDLEGRFQHALAVRITPDGESVIECLDDAHALEAFLTLSAERARLPEETAEK